MSQNIELKVLTPKDLKEFKVDASYMRQVNKSHAIDICKNFQKIYINSEHCDYTYPISISIRKDGSKVIIDGQHRVYAAIHANKSIGAICYKDLSIEEEMTIYLINNRMKMQSANHRMDLLARLDDNVKKIYSVLDDHLVGWDSKKSSIPRTAFVSFLFLIFYPIPKKDLKKIPFLLESVEESVYSYYNQIIQILCISSPYIHKDNKNSRQRTSESFWKRSDIYLALFRFVVLYHMRFGNNEKTNERLCEFIRSINNWNEIYEKSKNNRAFNSSLSLIIEAYNKGKRNFDHMIPMLGSKFSDKKLFPFSADYINTVHDMSKIRLSFTLKKKESKILDELVETN